MQPPPPPAGMSANGAGAGTTATAGEDPASSTKTAAGATRPRNESLSRPRKRGRIPRSCYECRRRKIKCNQECPCQPCSARGEANLCVSSARDSGPDVPHSLSLAQLLAPSDPPLAESFHPASLGAVEYLAKRVTTLENELRKRVGGLEGQAGLEGGSTGTLALLNGEGKAEGEDDEMTDSGESSATTEYAINVLESIALHSDQPAPRGDTEMSGSRSQVSDNSGRVHFSGSPNGSHSTQSMSLSQHSMHTHYPPDVTPSGNSTTIFLAPDVAPLLPALPSQFLTPSAAPSDVPGAITTLLLASLPSIPVACRLLKVFRKYIDGQWHVLWRPVFNAEVVQMWTAVELPGYDPRAIGPGGTYDSAWLAILYAAQSLAASATLAEDRAVLGWQESDAERWASTFAASSRLALFNSNWKRKPTVRALQAMLLQLAGLPHKGSPFHSPAVVSKSHCRMELLSTLQDAINIAKALGLHQLGQEPLSIRPGDLGWIQGNPIANAELGKRCWTFLVYIDLKTSDKERPCYITRDSYTTPLPSRYDDDQLLGAGNLVPCASTAFSDADVVLYQLSLAQHLKMLSVSVPKGSRIAYAKVKEIDIPLKALASDILGADEPQFFAPDGLDLTDNRRQISNAISNRRLRLHRPFIAKSFEDDQFSPSLQICLQCARAILTSFMSDEARARRVRWWAISHLMNAAVTLYTIRLHSSSHRRKSPTGADGLLLRHSDVVLLAAAQEMLQICAASLDKDVVDMAQRGHEVLKRLSQVDASATADGPAEPVHTLLRQVGVDVGLILSPTATHSSPSHSANSDHHFMAMTSATGPAAPTTGQQTIFDFPSDPILRSLGSPSTTNMEAGFASFLFSLEGDPFGSKSYWGS